MIARLQWVQEIIQMVVVLVMAMLIELGVVGGDDYLQLVDLVTEIDIFPERVVEE